MLDRIKEMVRLAEGLRGGDDLDAKVKKRALACLARFGQRLRTLPEVQVRAVGTNTLRRARDPEFARLAREALGHPIEVIPGLEEARLIYLGVSHSQPLTDGQMLVVDIGGGSTETIIGEGFEVMVPHSLFMGCVNYSTRFFPKGVITRDGFRAAETAAGLELQAIEKSLCEIGWDTAIGASGTINAASEILRLNGWGGPEITMSGLKKLRRAVIEAGRTDRLALEGLKPERTPVFPGGLAILLAVFRSLGVESMSPSTGALREGVLFDLIGRIRQEDVRDRTIRRLVGQYHVDLSQAARVERSALALLDQVGQVVDGEQAAARKLLAWAALLHEIGLAVSYTGYHKHGAYLVEHMHLPGFSADEQKLLAALIRCHRRKLVHAVFDALAPGQTEFALRLCVLLRLAVLLNRSRSPGLTGHPRLTWNDRDLEVQFPHGWLEEHPLTRADLDQEIRYLKAARISLGSRDAH
jgi:exopolyphosphatase/guanosine-5'-triphosphate,3'-diphosphate pyrophosphatase